MNIDFALHSPIIILSAFATLSIVVDAIKKNSQKTFDFRPWT